MGVIDDARVYGKQLTSGQLKSRNPNEVTRTLKPMIRFDFNGEKITDRPNGSGTASTHCRKATN